MQLEDDKPGIRYARSKPQQRDQLEKVWEYDKAMSCTFLEDEEYHRDIQLNQIFNYLINDDTMDNVLSELMTNGQKVHSGEDVGQDTIIFAYNHKHAERIVEAFPPARSRACGARRHCQLIDNQVKNDSALIAD